MKVIPYGLILSRRVPGPKLSRNRAKHGVKLLARRDCPADAIRPCRAAVRKFAFLPQQAFIACGRKIYVACRQICSQREKRAIIASPAHHNGARRDHLKFSAARKWYSGEARFRDAELQMSISGGRAHLRHAL